jgi:hypothetical protein
VFGVWGLSSEFRVLLESQGDGLQVCGTVSLRHLVLVVLKSCELALLEPVGQPACVFPCQRSCSGTAVLNLLVSDRETAGHSLNASGRHKTGRIQSKRGGQKERDAGRTNEEDKDSIPNGAKLPVLQLKRKPEWHLRRHLSLCFRQPGFVGVVHGCSKTSHVRACAAGRMGPGVF